MDLGAWVVLGAIAVLLVLALLRVAAVAVRRTPARTSGRHSVTITGESVAAEVG